MGGWVGCGRGQVCGQAGGGRAAAGGGAGEGEGEGERDSGRQAGRLPAPIGSHAVIPGVQRCTLHVGAPTHPGGF